MDKARNRGVTARSLNTTSAPPKAPPIVIASSETGATRADDSSSISRTNVHIEHVLSAPSKPTRPTKAKAPVRPGDIVVVSVDPIRTLQPLFEDDEDVEKSAYILEDQTRQYLAFVRSVEHSLVPPTAVSKANEKNPDALTVEEDATIRRPSVGSTITGIPPPIKPPTSSTTTTVHLNLLHSSPPTRSRYDTVDELMTVSLALSQGKSPSVIHQRAPLEVRNKHLLPFQDLYAHTIMDVYAITTDCPQSTEVTTSRKRRERVSIPFRELKRYDDFQSADRLRESSQSSSLPPSRHSLDGAGSDFLSPEDFGDAPPGDDFDDFRLSTVISALSVGEEYTFGLEVEDEFGRRTPTSTISAQYAHILGIDGVRRKSAGSSKRGGGTPIQMGPSAWRSLARSPSQRSRQQQQQQQPRGDYPTVPPLPQRLDNAVVARIPSPIKPEPVQPKATDPIPQGRHSTSDSMSASASESRDTTSASQASTAATSLHSEASVSSCCSSSPNDTEDEQAQEEVSPLGEDDLPAPRKCQLGGGLGSQKPENRQCAIHVSISLDLETFCSSSHDLDDPRLFFEELKILRALERSSDMRYISRVRETNAERVMAWRSTMGPEPTSLITGSDADAGVRPKASPHPLTVNIFSSLNPFASVPPTPTHSLGHTNVSSLSPATPNTCKFPASSSNRSSFLPFVKRQSLGGHALKDNHEDQPDEPHRRRGSMPVKKTQSKRPSFIAFSKQRTSLPVGAPPPLPSLPPWHTSPPLSQLAAREEVSVDPLDSTPPEPRNRYLSVQMEMNTPTVPENEMQYDRRASESKFKRVWKILTCRPAK